MKWHPSQIGKLNRYHHGAMVEVIAAIAGASISVAAMGAAGFSRKSDEGNTQDFCAFARALSDCTRRDFRSRRWEL